jgi:hypothetical protein
MINKMYRLLWERVGKEIRTILPKVSQGFGFGLGVGLGVNFINRFNKEEKR